MCSDLMADTTKVGGTFRAGGVQPYRPVDEINGVYISTEDNIW